MVLLYQHSLRRHHRSLHHNLLQRLKAPSQERARNPKQSQAHGSDRDPDVHSSHHLHPAVTPVGRNEVRLGQRSDNCALRPLRCFRLAMVCRPVLETRRGHSPTTATEESQCPWRRDPRHVSGWLILRVRILCECPRSQISPRVRPSLTPAAPNLVPSHQGSLSLRIRNRQPPHGGLNDCLLRTRRGSREPHRLLHTTHVRRKRPPNNRRGALHNTPSRDRTRSLDRIPGRPRRGSRRRVPAVYQRTPDRVAIARYPRWDRDNHFLPKPKRGTLHLHRTKRLPEQTRGKPDSIRSQNQSRFYHRGWSS